MVNKMQSIKTLLGNIQTGSVISKSIGTNSVNSGQLGTGWVLPFDEKIKRYEVFESDEDLLALSVCWKRLRDSRLNGYPIVSITKLTDRELFDHVTSDDRTLASTIRDYYSKKIMLLKLKNIELTKFRHDLNEFIHSDGKIFKETMLPLAYRLPEFYEYDVNFEKFTTDVNRSLVDFKKISNTHKKLKLLQKVVVSRNRYRRTEYWFSDDKNNLVNLNFDNNNYLISLLDKCIIEDDIELDGIFTKRERDGQEFLKSDKYRFI